jgi:hypothetical protein
VEEIMQREDREYYIRERAYHLWENEGRPEGQDERHWHTAAEEWETVLAAHEKGAAYQDGGSVGQGASGVGTGLQQGGTTPGGDNPSAPGVEAISTRAKMRRSA